MNADDTFMKRAIELAQQGYPAPNPRVGAVVVQQGSIVGEGYHDHRGGPHAEVGALEQAGNAARGATLYVTLEPCNHHGRTPPCSEAVIRAGIARVVMAQRDPNATAAGGAARLREAGIEVVEGCQQEAAAEMNRYFLHRHATGRPFVVLKAGITLDGKIAPEPKRTLVITSEEARTHARLKRAELGAVLVGWNTVAIDNPLLTARDSRVRNEPLRAILDPNARLSGKEKIFQQPGETLWLVRDAQRDAQTQQADFAPAKIIETLANRGMIGVLVEGGAQTIGRFLEADCFDQIDLYLAPQVLGLGLDWNGGAGSRRRLEIIGDEALGGDRFIQIRPVTS